MTKARIAAAIAVLTLAACQPSKDTGPQDEQSQGVPAVATPVPPATADPAAAKPLSSFAGMDADGDGIVTSAEHANAAQTMFRMMDGDADGTVTVAEMDAARTAIGGSAALSSEKKIAAVDSDRDGKLTLAEHVAGSNTMFAGMDANKDGRLDRAEWDKGHAAVAPAATREPSG
ncbi:MAG: EF-hand domain-containing protein [Novosphingobium sp.]|nr:EF-hand domain-containing protein [Novosphingobium sp.]